MNVYGVRVFVNIAAGVVCCLVWLGTMFVQPGGWSERVQIHAAGVWLVSLLYLASYFAPALRKRLALRMTLPMLAGVLLVQSLVIWDQDGPRVFGELLSNADMACLLLVGPLLINSARDHIFKSHWVREIMRFGKGNNARWATHDDFDKFATQLPKTKNGKLGWLNVIPLGFTRFRHDFVPRLIGLPFEHLITIGGSGSGKSATSEWVIEGLVGVAMFVIDMKGEHARVCGRRREQLGPVRYVDPNKVTGKHSCQFNPLYGIDVRTYEGLRRIAEIVSALVLDESNTKHGAHFSDNAKTILEGVITYICWKYPVHLRTLVTVYYLMTNRNPASARHESNPDLFDAFVARMSQCPYGKCAAAAKLFLDVGENERGSFLSTVARSITWLSSPGMQYVFSGHDFNFAELATLADRKPTIYVAVGIGYETECIRYIRLMTAMAILAVREEHLRSGVAPSPGIVFSLDEYPLYAKGLDCVGGRGFATLREIGIMLHAQSQSRGQIVDALGGENAAAAVFQNATLRVFGLHNEPGLLAFLSKALGSHRVTKRWGTGLFAEVVSSTVESLMTERALRDAFPQLGRGQLILPIGDTPPMWIDRVQYMYFKIKGLLRWWPLNLGNIFDP